MNVAINISKRNDSRFIKRWNESGATGSIPPRKQSQPVFFTRPAPVRRIPNISDERVAELSARIRPMVRMARIRTSIKKNGASEVIEMRMYPHKQGKLQNWDDGDLHYIKAVDPRGVAFTWEAKSDGAAVGLKPIAEITTYHTFGYHGFFKPSVAEVLAQIPGELADAVLAFETIGPKHASDLNAHWKELNEGYHVAKTILYGLADDAIQRHSDLVDKKCSEGLNADEIDEFAKLVDLLNRSEQPFYREMIEKIRAIG